MPSPPTYWTTTSSSEIGRRAHAAIRGHSPRFRAVGCTQAVDALTNASLSGTGVPIYYLNGNKMADDYTDFLDGSWDETKEGRNQSGNAVSRTVTVVWTGCQDNGNLGINGAVLGSSASASRSRPFEGDGGLDSGVLYATNLLGWTFGLSPVYQAPGVTVPANISVPEETAVFAATFTGDPEVDVTITSRYINRSATGGGPCAPSNGDFQDYVFPQAISVGRESYNVGRFQICGDMEAEPDETFTVTWTANADIFSTAAANCSSRRACTTTVTIVDDDSAVGVPANWPLKPSAVGHGERFRLMFVTSATAKAQSNHMPSYNRIIQDHAAAGHTEIRGDSLRFRTVGCTQAVTALANANLIGTGLPIYYLGGNKVADDYYDFRDGSWDEATTGRDESGSAMTGQNLEVWSGCNDNGTQRTAPGQGTLGNNSRVGITLLFRNDGGLADSIARPLDQDRRLFGLSPVFQAPGITVPATLSAPEEAASVSATLTGFTDANVSVSVSFTSGSATGGSDCATSGTDFDNDAPVTQILADGKSEHSLTVIAICTDTSSEINETFAVIWTAAQGIFDASADHCTTTTVCTTTVSIVDEDGVFPLVASWALKPPGVGDGDQFRLLFITSATTSAESTGIRDYNQFAQDRAAAGHTAIHEYSWHFRAVGCTQAVDALVNANLSGTGVPIYYLNGNKVADDYADFLDGAWDESSTGRDESDNAVTGSSKGVWSGCEDDGTVDGSMYLGHSSSVRASDLFASSGGLEGSSAPAPSVSQSLYALSPVLQAESIIVPASISVSEDAASFSLTLDGSPGVNVDMSVAFTNGTATGGADCATAGTDFDNDAPAQQTITNGQSSHTLSAPKICADTAVESDETFTVTWTATQGVFDASGANCTSATVCTTTVTIVDEDKVVQVASDWALKPSGVNVGGRFRLLFISSTRRNAQSAAMRDYNQFIQDTAAAGHAAIRGDSLRFRTVGCTQAVTALTNANLSGTGVPIYYLSGNKVADDYADFLDGTWDETTMA